RSRPIRASRSCTRSSAGSRAPRSRWWNALPVDECSPRGFSGRDRVPKSLSHFVVFASGGSRLPDPGGTPAPQLRRIRTLTKPWDDWRARAESEPIAQSGNAESRVMHMPPHKLNARRGGRRVVLVTLGSWGDVLPYLAIALGLQERGHQAILATSAC